MPGLGPVVGELIQAPAFRLDLLDDFRRAGDGTAGPSRGPGHVEAVQQDGVAFAGRPGRVAPAVAALLSLMSPIGPSRVRVL